MEIVKQYFKEDILKMTRKRSGEEKIGDGVDAVSKDWKKDLERSSGRYVILGIAEDIGVRANYGRAGAATAFKPALDSFLNQQTNVFIDPSSVFVLGEVLVDDLMETAVGLDMKNKAELLQLRDLVAVIDERVSLVVEFIVSLQKIPIFSLTYTYFLTYGTTMLNKLSDGLPILG